MTINLEIKGLEEDLQVLDMRFEETTEEIAIDMGSFVQVPANVDPYMGDYEVTPKVDAQVLPTAQKLMTQDLTVKAIPIYDVSNNSGGRTVYIAREV